MKKTLILIICSVVLVNCSKNEESIENKIFTNLKHSETGIDFQNTLAENDTLNYMTYAYMYMGGGVSVGDINNDGFIDVFFTGNMVSNRLYLNKGGLKFEDITQNIFGECE